MLLTTSLSWPKALSKPQAPAASCREREREREEERKRERERGRVGGRGRRRGRGRERTRERGREREGQKERKRRDEREREDVIIASQSWTTTHVAHKEPGNCGHTYLDFWQWCWVVYVIEQSDKLFNRESVHVILMTATHGKTKSRRHACLYNLKHFQIFY